MNACARGCEADESVVEHPAGQRGELLARLIGQVGRLRPRNGVRGSDDSQHIDRAVDDLAGDNLLSQLENGAFADKDLVEGAVRGLRLVSQARVDFWHFSEHLMVV